MLTSPCNVDPLTSHFNLYNKTGVYSLISLYVSCSGLIISVGEERANLSPIVYLQLCVFCSERFPLPLGTWNGLRYFIVALPVPSI